jgi:hypothetical protein
MLQVEGFPLPPPKTCTRNCFEDHYRPRRRVAYPPHPWRSYREGLV